MFTDAAVWRTWGWGFWAIAPIVVLAFHYGPGQDLIKRDLAIDAMRLAHKAEADASRLQAIAYDAQLETLSARRRLLQEDSESNRLQLQRGIVREQAAYREASDAWKLAADRYQEVETLLDRTGQANQVRWLRGRALVRAGEVFNGIEELTATLEEALGKNSTAADPRLAQATREELAAAHYYGARLLREEGRAAEVWKQVSETSRQQYRYLAESDSELNASSASTQSSVASNMQRNLERVLDLEQQERSELVGRPIPRDSPRARRPGDGEPGKRPGVGPPQGDRPGNGASGMMEIGAGW